MKIGDTGNTSSDSCSRRTRGTDTHPQHENHPRKRWEEMTAGGEEKTEKYRPHQAPATGEAEEGG